MTMWTRSQNEPTRTAAPAPAPEPSRSPAPPRTANVGASIAFKGELTGEEDLLIDGRVEGQVTLRKHSVIVGASGRVKADIQALSIRVEGQVEGDLVGEEEVVIRQSGKVIGNVTAPRVTLENGARFRGSIDMQADKRGESAGEGRARAAAPSEPRTPASRATGSAPKQAP